MQGMRDILDIQGLLERIQTALDRKQPLSFVRVGDGENLVLAQDSVWPMEQVLREPWAIKAHYGKKGVTLPNLKLRDELVNVLRKADIVGILPPEDVSIQTEAYLKRELTDRVFAHFNLKPLCTCHAGVNRALALNPAFWSILRGRKVLVITSKSEDLKTVLAEKPFELHIAEALPFSHYNEIGKIREWLLTHPDDFDVAIISCGVNALLLVQMVKEQTGKVGIDFGKGRNILLQERF